MPDRAANTLRYYETNARTFFDDTVAVDMSELQARFLRWIPPGGQILDAGCGSGRDARAFRERGYRVTAFDASPELARLAAEHGGIQVRTLRFDEVDWRNAFDGIWACASLLHVPAADLPGILRRLAAALKPGGALYASFKYGRGEREHGGRQFTDLDEPGLEALRRLVPRLTICDLWVTGDRRPGREAEPWLNAVMRTAPAEAVAPASTAAEE